MIKYYFLILAFNEEKNLLRTFKKLKTTIKLRKLSNYKIIINNDGSNDRTEKIAIKIKNKFDNNIEIISYKKNIGVAKSIKKFISKHNKGKLIVVSGDNELDEILLKNLINASKKSDFVLSYFINREKKGRFRANMSTLFNLIFCTIFDVYAFYLQGPFVWPLDKIKKMSIFSNGIAYCSEVNIKLLHSGLKYAEVAGNMATRSNKYSTSYKIFNFLDIIITTIFLIFEIKILKKYKIKSKRILI
tara:strand:+ start:1108 stop:1842 length:735 start_codon:yes stop_codon:yes gene_type:complete